jgi:hypothetical protein
LETYDFLWSGFFGILDVSWLHYSFPENRGFWPPGGRGLQDLCPGLSGAWPRRKNFFPGPGYDSLKIQEQFSPALDIASPIPDD